MPDDNDSTADATANIARISVRPPPFWKTNPTLWFAQIEAQFDLSGITADKTKFNHVLAAVESDVLNSVLDLILKPPADNKYLAIKSRLIEIHSESEESKIRKLLQGLEIGDQRPSQLLTRMRSLAGTNVSDPLLKSLWISRLPSTTQSVLTALNDDLQQLATVADKISDLTGNNLSVVSSVSQSTSALEQQVAALSAQMSELSQKIERRDRSRERNDYSSRSRSPSRGRSNRYREPENGMCFYHTNFGRKARQCIKPCSFRQPEN